MVNVESMMLSAVKPRTQTIHATRLTLSLRSAGGVLSLPPHKIYTLLASIFGLILLVITPPMGVGDEPAHFERAFEVATGQWVGAENLPAGVHEFVAEAKRRLSGIDAPQDENIVRLQDIALQAENAQPYDNSFMKILRIHNPIAYAPYVPVVWAGLAFDWPPMVIFTLCRLTTLLIAIFLLRTAIRILPSHKRLAMFLALTPTPLVYIGAMNIDAFLIGIAFLVFAMIARFAHETDRPVTGRQTVMFALVAAGLGVMKAPYVMLPLLSVFIPSVRFSSLAQRLGFVASAFLPGVLIALVWALTVKTFIIGDLAYSTNAGSYVSPSEQMALLTSNLFHFPTVILKTFFGTDFVQYAVFTSFAQAGWSVPILPSWGYAVLMITALALWASTEREEGALSSTLAVTAQVGVFAAIVLTAMLLLYLQWTSVGASTVAGFQGRYLTPIMPLLFCTAPRNLKIISSNASKTFLAAGIPVLMAMLTAIILYKTYAV